MNEESIKYIIARLIDNANDAMDEAEDDFFNGKRLAYYEMLDTIKNELEAHDQNLKDFGLDVNLEKKYLNHSK